MAVISIRNQICSPAFCASHPSLISRIARYSLTFNLLTCIKRVWHNRSNKRNVGRLTFVLSKLIPFWAAGLFVITIGMIIGWLVYDLKPEGSITSIYLASLLFIIIMSGIEVMIANTSSTMLQSIMVMFAIIIVFQLMGGLSTPVSSMPQWAQTITYLLPPRYFNEIMRSVYLKGADISDLNTQYTTQRLYQLPPAPHFSLP